MFTWWTPLTKKQRLQMDKKNKRFDKRIARQLRKHETLHQLFEHHHKQVANKEMK